MEVSASTLNALVEHFGRRQEEILRLTRALVETESPSGDAAGSAAVVALLSAAARTIPGVTVEQIPAPNYGQHLRVTVGAHSRHKPIMLLGHTDTVHPRGSLEQRPWRVDGNRIHGPGIFDMKASCALALEVIGACAAHDLPSKRPIVLLLTCDEETGSLKGRALLEDEAKKSHAVLVIEPPARGGLVKTGRKGTGMFTIEARGIASHAGLDPQRGASAILELARQTEHLHSLNGWAEGISVNVGVFNGGTLSNVVAAEARAEVDVRFTTVVEAQRVDQELRNLRVFDSRVQLTVTGGINRPPLERSEKVLKLYRQAKHIAEEMGFELGETQVGGASDGNFVSALDLPVLDGLGIDGDGAHAAHEHILADDIPRRGALLTGLIASLSDKL